MTDAPFATPIEAHGSDFAGPWRAPRNMLTEQTYDAHASLHDDATAQKLGFKGGAVEGPTHFSQIAPLGVALFGKRFLKEGCISAHYRNVVFEGEEVRAWASKPEPGETQAQVWAEKRDGTEVLRGTISVGPAAAPTALDERLAGLSPLADPVILHDVRVGARTRRQSICMQPDQHMGDLYPFSLNDKLQKITESSPWYAQGSPFGKPVVPFEMISVLLQYSSRDDRMPTKGPAVGLFADQEIKLIDGPLLAGEDYEIEREVVALSGSRRTESMWVRTFVRRPGDEAVIATMLLNHAILKESYAPYAAERAALYPG